MADRVLRGSRMGAVSYETDRDHDLAPRRMVKYKTDSGEIFEVPFADDAELPEEWLCKNGQMGTLMEGEGVEGKPVKPPRTHWDMLCERRSMEELDELLDERIEYLRKRRRNAAKLLKQQKEEEERAKQEAGK
ncbi:MULTISPECIES: RNA polymerase-binding protein RbpA [Corynebacterium]|uniref:RNA polymerase-binding protein RbpA n=1 Tax=Corynebacterium TaxID=1716 RepID=UPI00124ED0AD|nr:MULTISPECIES: RNA polymerase-binding protein RbpA [Corynebacterium]MBV7280845.1 RNA polymerase-binding protein RbpA [Corynebacterium sp. TAE3-ERU30]MBV7302571.1 RNA polymerase-binding protein RbpA [Corynebacterium sp. TAE3-ERU2]